MHKGKTHKKVLIVLVVLMVIILAMFFVPGVEEKLRGAGLGIIGLFSLLGFVLLWLLKKEKVEGEKKKWLKLTGVGAAGVMVFVLAHNLLYGLGVWLWGKDFWGGGDEPFFFILALFACPLAFGWGIVKYILTLKKKDKNN